MAEIFGNCAIKLDGALGVRHLEAGHVSAMQGEVTADSKLVIGSISQAAVMLRALVRTRAVSLRGSQ